MLGGAVQEYKDRAGEVSPQTHITADDASFLILHGTEDPLVPYDQSVQYGRALQAAGVASLLFTLEGGGHVGFGSSETAERVQAFLDRHLFGKTVEIANGTVIAGPGRNER